MAEEPHFSRKERLEEFLRRLKAATPAASHDEAYDLVWRLLIEVEDEMTTIPFDPSFPRDDGRMYPPLKDYSGPALRLSNVIRYRSVAHDTLIGPNGAIRIVDLYQSTRIIDKPGVDGRTIGRRRKP